MEIHYFDTLESTNNYCKLLDPNTVEEFTVICAYTQTSGVGQQGNVWTSEPNKNLTFSIILKPTFIQTSDQYQLTMALAVAIAETVEETLSKFRIQKSTFIKWPNDIYVGSKKICGTLITSKISNDHIKQAICGVGLNVNQTEFPEWVPNPTSLKLLTNEECELDTLLDSLLENIESNYQQLKEDSKKIERKYLQRLYRLGQISDYVYQGKQIRATITGVNRFGQLMLVADNSKIICCDLKEIKFII